MIHVMMCLFSMSMQAALIIGVVFVIRKLFSVMHISKKYVMLLWMISFFFLVFPWKITVSKGFWRQTAAEFGIGMEQNTPAAETMVKQTEKSETANLKPDHAAGLTAALIEKSGDMQALLHDEKSINAERAKTRGFLDYMPFLGESKKQQTLGFLCIVWIAGMLCFLLYGAVSYWRLERKVLCSIRREGSRNPAVYYTDGTQVPVTLGYFKPRIYLPADINETYAEYVIAHENTHIERKDSIKKAAAYFITCLHWPNPVVWLAYYFMAKDMEMACDEETVLKLGMDRRKAYAAALLQLSAGRGNIFAVPPAFGTGDIKTRIKNIVHYEKTMKTTAVLAVAAGLCITGIFLTADNKASAVNAETANDVKTADEQNLSAEDKPALAQKQPEAGSLALAQENADENELTFTVLRQAFAEKTAHKLAFSEYTNGRRNDGPDPDSRTFDIFFYFQYENENYRLQVTLFKSTGMPEDIYIYRFSDKEFAWLYTNREGRQEDYPRDLEVYLNTKTAIEDWLTLELPDGYTLGSYDADVGDAGGALISPQVYQTQGEAFAPDWWKYAGFVGRVANTEDCFVFENGKLDENRFPHANHSTEEAVGMLDDVSDDGWQALMVHSNHDLYTASGLGDLEQKGVDIDSLETESEYWKFYFVKEGEENAYVLSLSAKEFTKEEAAAAARTVKFTEGSAEKSRKKAVQDVLETYFAGFLNTMLASSSKDYGRSDFASINGYIAAKWFVTRREIYKTLMQGIHAADVTGIELQKLTEAEGGLEALAYVNYQYAWGGSDSKENTDEAGILFRVGLKQAGDTYQVTDIDCDGKETMMVKEAVARAGADTAGSYQIVDGYFEEIQQNAKEMAKSDTK